MRMRTPSPLDKEVSPRSRVLAQLLLARPRIPPWAYIAQMCIDAYIYTCIIYTYIHMYIIYIYINIRRYLICCFDGNPPQQICTPISVSTSVEYMHACLRPTERSEACPERSEEGRDWKLSITQTRLKTAHNTNKKNAHDTNKQLHITTSETANNTSYKLHRTQTRICTYQGGYRVGVQI